MDKQYLELLADVRDGGRIKGNRTGVTTVSAWGRMLRFNLAEAFPVPVSKKLFWRGAFEETLWMLHGKTDATELQQRGVHIWDKWAIRQEDLDAARGVRKSPPDLLREFQYAAENPPEGLKRFRCDTAAYVFHTNHRNMSEQAFDNWLLEYGVDPYLRPAVPVGSIGPLYGHVWRDFNGVDQIKELLVNLRERPLSRRHVVSAWNPKLLPDETKPPRQNVLEGRGALAPCHVMFLYSCDPLSLVERCALAQQLNWKIQYEDYFHPNSTYPLEDGEERYDGAEERLRNQLDAWQIPLYRLNSMLLMRSNDLPLGCPFNIAGYALLTHLLAHELNYAVGEHVHVMADAHIYTDQMEGVVENLRRMWKQEYDELQRPQLRIKRPIGTSIFDIKIEDLELVGYKPLDSIKMPVAE